MSGGAVECIDAGIIDSDLDKYQVIKFEGLLYIRYLFVKIMEIRGI